MDQTTGLLAYFDAARTVLDTIVSTQLKELEAAATVVQQTIEQGGMVYIFGSGHSHLLAEEGHYRAGGLAPVCPVLSSSLMLHEGAVASTNFERTSGVGPATLQRYRPTDRDMIFVISNSGVNAAPVEVAMAAKGNGMPVIALVAENYANQIPPKIQGKKLTDVADIVIDNCGVAGDALVEIESRGIRTGPVSTVAGAFILNAIFTEVAARLAATEEAPPIYISANMPGAEEHNLQLVELYRQRNPHL